MTTVDLDTKFPASMAHPGIAGKKYYAGWDVNDVTGAIGAFNLNVRMLKNWIASKRKMV